MTNYELASLVIQTFASAIGALILWWTHHVSKGVARIEENQNGLVTKVVAVAREEGRTAGRIEVLEKKVEEAKNA